MSATPLFSDDLIEAVVADRPLGPAHASLVTFARSVRALGEGPAPRPSAELAALLEHGLDTAAEATGVPEGPTAARAAGWAARVAGLGIVAKVALGSSLAAAGVGAAGAAGVLPAPANDTVRHAIESVTPVEFDDGGAGSDRPAPSSTAPAGDEGDGTDPTVGNDATGADHPSGGSAVEEPPGQSGETGLTQANETPAAPHAPDSTPAVTSPGATAPSTIPTQGPPDQPGQGGASGSVPSTVPAARGDHADDQRLIAP
jgi:hypothetical protein